MSFSVRRDETGLEYGGGSLDALFARRTNLLRPSFLRMCRDIPRFYREATRLVESLDEKVTLGDWLEGRQYSREFVDDHLLPMGAAIWSTDIDRMREFPAVSLARFFQNHGLLSLRDRPQWRTIEGGSRRYVDALTRPFAAAIRLSEPVTGIRRHRDHVEISSVRVDRERFDQVIIATHSDQALHMLSDASDAERAVLGSIAYQPNSVVLHTDASLMPRRRRAWSSWNYHLLGECASRVCLTYNMNILQGLDVGRDLLVSVNGDALIQPDSVIERFDYAHPVFDGRAMQAQRDRALISGRNRTHYCGAYWGYGFHEDGVVSALEVCRRFGLELAA
jgi:predicted NAD/FAD-binding protein